MKKISVVALILALSIVFTGCTSNELKLYKAFNKSQDVTSMESDTVVNFTLEGEGFSAEDQQGIQEVTNMLKDSKITMHQRMIQNEEKTASRALVDTGLDFGGMNMDMQVWVDADMSSDAPKLLEIIKMPPVMMNSMSPEDEGKEYIVYDFEKLMNAGGEEVNFNELMKFSKDIQPKVTNFFKDYQENFDPEIEIVRYKGARTVDGKTLSIYELKLDDESFKELIRYTVNYSMDNKNTMEFIKEYMDVVMSITEVPELKEQSAQDEINAELDKLEKDLPKLKKQFNEFMDASKDVKVIGDKGIVIEYGVNSDGYIVHEAGAIDIRIDLETIGKAMGESVPVTKGVLNLGMNYNTKVYNINKDMKINMPKVDANNSIYFNDLMELGNTVTNEPQEDQPIPTEESK